MRHIEPDVETWRDYKPGSSFSDHEVEKMAIGAWKYHLRKRGEYLPDRLLPDHVHLDHVRILSAALRDYKRLRIDTNMSWIQTAHGPGNGRVERPVEEKVCSSESVLQHANGRHSGLHTVTQLEQTRETCGQS